MSKEADIKQVRHEYMFISSKKWLVALYNHLCFQDFDWIPILQSGRTLSWLDFNIENTWLLLQW